MDDGLVDFLRARFDEDEAPARAADAGLGNVLNQVEYSDSAAEADERHIARHDPARVLREVEAKRRVVDRYSWLREHGDTGDMAWVLPLLAAAYADHPDYRPEWAPTT